MGTKPKCDYLPNCSIETMAAKERYPFGVFRSTVSSDAIKTSSLTAMSSNSCSIAIFFPCPGFTSGAATSVIRVWAFSSQELSLSWNNSNDYSNQER